MKNPTHSAAVVGDTVGDPFKDTSGPSLNILLKLMSVVALVIAPSIAINNDAVKDMFLAVQPKQSYLDVPGFDNKQGFGGKCLPKDLDFLISTLDVQGINSTVFKEIKKLNKE